MKVILFIADFFKKGDAYSSLFSSAFNEAIRDVFKEMGHSLGQENKRKENQKGYLK